METKNGDVDVKRLAAEVQGNTIFWRRELHQIPELGMDLPQTSAYIKQELAKMDIPSKTYLNGMAVAARIQGAKGTGRGLRLGLRADMDALPVQEETGLSFASDSGCMHACAHDGHMAMLLGAAKVLSAHADLFSGEVILIFQPSEEVPPGGALPMLAEGLLHDFPLDFIVGIHAGIVNPATKPGSINWKEGPLMAAVDTFILRFIGESSHAAHPEQSRDPIAAAAQFITALQSIKSRNIKASDLAVISIGKIQGGVSQNIIPETVELQGTVRSFAPEVRDKIENRIKQIAEGICLAMDVQAKLDFQRNYPAVVNDGDFTRRIAASLAKILDSSELNQMQDPVMIGEDFAYFLNEVPGTFLFLTNPKAQNGENYPHHHPRFDINEEQLTLGVTAFVQIALDLLQ